VGRLQRRRFPDLYVSQYGRASFTGTSRREFTDVTEKPGCNSGWSSSAVCLTMNDAKLDLFVCRFAFDKSKNKFCGMKHTRDVLLHS